jgi:predicted nucleic acid-binding protein
MANIFLDTNAFIDLVKNRRNLGNLDYSKDRFYISVLTIHIFTYAMKIKIPNKSLDQALKMYQIIPIEVSTALKALSGPTSDFEDNIQLHSAVDSECDYFLTNDQALIKLSYFGKTKITSTIN